MLDDPWIIFLETRDKISNLQHRPAVKAVPRLHPRFLLSFSSQTNQLQKVSTLSLFAASILVLYDESRKK